MMSAASINDSACLWYQWQNNPELVTRRVVEEIREIKPQVIITFNKYSAYGHPDHIAIQSATTEAFKLAADSNYNTDQEPYAPQKLYYSSIPEFAIRFFIFILRLRGIDPKKGGSNGDIDYTKIIDNIEPTHANIDIGDYLDKADEASACHKSQGGGRGWFSNLAKPLRFILEANLIRRLMQGKQGHTRIYPVPQGHRVDENEPALA